MAVIVVRLIVTVGVIAESVVNVGLALVENVAAILILRAIVHGSNCISSNTNSKNRSRNRIITRRSLVTDCDMAGSRNSSRSCGSNSVQSNSSNSSENSKSNCGSSSNSSSNSKSNSSNSVLAEFVANVVFVFARPAA